MPNATVHLSDVQRLLSLFTQGLAGRYLHLKSTDSLTGRFRPEGATTDGAAIYLPELVEEFEQWRHNLGIYRVSILHQLGYYEFGTFEFSIAEALQRISKLPDESFATADHPVDLERFFARFPQQTLARRLFMMLEDYRIDCQLPRRFPGIKTDLQRVMSHALAQRDPLPDDTWTGSAVLEGLLQFTLGGPRQAIGRAEPSGCLAMMLAAAATLDEPESDVYETARATLRCYRALNVRASLTAKAKSDQPLDDSQLDAEAEEMETFFADDDFDMTGDTQVSDEDMEISGAEFRGDLQPELVQRHMRLADMQAQTQAVEAMADQMSPEQIARQMNLPTDFDKPTLETDPNQPEAPSLSGPAPQSAAPRPADADSIARLIRDELFAKKRRVQREESVLRREFGKLTDSARSFLHDEWDYLQQSYRKGWCRLFEERLQGEDFDHFRKVRLKHRVLASRIEEQLRRIRAESLARVKRVADGDEIDLDQLLDTIMDRRAGLAPDDRVYSRRDRTRREVAAAFLLDMSASTDDTIPDPDAEPPPPLPDDPEDPYYYSFGDLQPDAREKRRVIDVEKDALILMSEALTVLGDAFAIYGFSGYGHDEVEFYVAKEFEEALTSRTKASLAAMEPRRSTRMGPAIRHTIRRLERQDVPLKVMIILSDGFPQDCDYGPDRSDHEYGIQDTARALTEAENRGILTFCITVDRAGHDYLRRMCPENRYLVIDEIESLPNELSKIYRSLTV